MSLKTRIRGYTAWVNLRLKPYDQLINNVTMDILAGTNLKYLLHSLTGRELKRLESCDGYVSLLLGGGGGGGIIDFLK